MNTTSGTGFKMKHAVAWYQSRCLLATQTASQASVSKASPWIYSKFSEIRRVSSLRDFGLGNPKNCCSCCSWHLISFSFITRDFGTSISLGKEAIELLISCVWRNNVLIVRLNVISLSGDSCFEGCVPLGIWNCKGFPCFLFFDIVFLRNVRNRICRMLVQISFLILQDFLNSELFFQYNRIAC